MIDIVINAGWAVGIVLFWYPIYEKALGTLADPDRDTEDRVMSAFFSGIIAIFWPVVLALVLVGGAVFFVSRGVTHGVRRLWRSL